MQRTILIICIVLSIIAPSVILPEMLKGGSETEKNKDWTSADYVVKATEFVRALAYLWASQRSG